MEEEKLKIIVTVFTFIVIALPFLNIIFNLFISNFSLSDLLILLDHRLIKIFLRSVGTCLLVGILSTLVGFLVAYFLEFTDVKYKKIWRWLLFSPFIIPTYLFTFSWLGFLGKRGTFTTLTFFNVPINIYNIPFLVFILTLSLFPIPMFLISLGMRSIDENILNAGRISNEKKVFKKIILPLMKPYLIVSTFIVFSLAMSEYTTPSFLRINTYQNEVFIQLAAFYNVKRAIIYSVPLLLLTSLLSLSSFKTIGMKYATITGSFKRRRFVKNLSKLSKVFVYLFFSLLLFFSLIVPTIMLLIESKLSLFYGFSKAKNEILNSLIVSVPSSFFITFFSFFIFYFFKNSRILDILIVAPLTLSAPVIAISLISLYSNTPLYGTLALLILGYTIRFLPFSILTLSPFVARISKSLEDSAKLVTQNFFKVFLKILLPLSKNGFVSSFVLAFILCLTEVSLTLMLAPAGFQTLPMRIEIVMHYANYRLVASLTLILLSLIFPLYLIYCTVSRWDT